METLQTTPPPPHIEGGDITKLLTTVREYLPPDDLTLIIRAYEYAATAHAGKHRHSGDPYIVHPVGAAQKLADMRLSAPIVAAGLLHDVIEDAGISRDEIARHFGEEIAFLVDGVTKIGTVRLQGERRYIENLRKMFVTMAKDIRIIIIKFCDRLHNLETLQYVPERKRLRIARESLEIHAPIANRLGMYEIKAQLEDLAFPIVQPVEAAWLETLVVPGEQRRHAIRTALEREVATLFAQHHMAIVEAEGRLKHRYSLYLKLLAHDRDIQQIHDLLALRIVVRDVTDCYAVLGIIHQRWKPLRGRLKDYIAAPKANGYQGIHTTVALEDGETVEFQVRTAEMHEQAEWGAAAAWRYHERGSYRPPMHQLRWVEDLIAWQRATQDSQEFLSGLQLDVLKDRILVFTPKGDVIELPDGATPLDFAYAIHSDIGNRAIGARVNGERALHPLDRPLENGALIEIITDPKRKGPSPDWLGFVKTAHARTKIRDAIRVQQRTTTGQWDARVPAATQRKSK